MYIYNKTFDRDEEELSAYDFLMEFVVLLVEEHLVTDDEVRAYTTAPTYIGSSYKQNFVVPTGMLAHA